MADCTKCYRHIEGEPVEVNEMLYHKECVSEGHTCIDIENAQTGKECQACKDEALEKVPHTGAVSEEEIEATAESSMHDPDHLSPAEGGNRAGDDYW